MATATLQAHFASPLADDFAFLDQAGFEALLNQPFSPSASSSSYDMPQLVDLPPQPHTSKADVSSLLGLSDIQLPPAPTAVTQPWGYGAAEPQQTPLVYSYPAFDPAPQPAANRAATQHSELSSVGSGGSGSVAAGRSGSSQGDDLSPSEARKVMQQANRAKASTRSAQKRYRERSKKKLADSDERVAELTEQLQMLRMQKESLAFRNSMLEKLLAANAAQKAEGLQSVVQRSATAWWLDATTRMMLEEMMQLGPTLTFTVHPGPPVTLARQKVEAMSAEEYTPLWQAYINAFAEALLACGADGADSPAGRRIEELMYEAWRLQVAVCLSRPDIMSQSYDRALCSGQQDGTSGGGAAPADLLLALNLRPLQRRALLGLRKLYLLNLGRLVARREKLMAQMQSLASAEQQGGTSEGVLAVNELRQTLCEEHSLYCQFMLGCWRQVLTPFQAASVTLQAHPGKADMVGIVNELAAGQHGCSKMAAPYAQLVADGAARPAAMIPPLDAALAMLPTYMSKGPEACGCKNEDC